VTASALGSDLEVLIDGWAPSTQGAAMKLERAVDRRRSSRGTASWPVAVFTEDRIFSGFTRDIGSWGTWVRLDGSLLEEWKLVHLRVCPPDEPVFDVMALVWRVEPDGVALFFFKEWEQAISEERMLSGQRSRNGCLRAASALHPPLSARHAQVLRFGLRREPCTSRT
jgi:hypothetical protein